MKRRDLVRLATRPWEIIADGDAEHWLLRKRVLGPAEGIRMAEELLPLMSAPPEPDRHQDRLFWNRLAPRYDRSTRLLGRPLPRVRELVVEAVAGAGSVLEVAAGTGYFSLGVAPRVGRLVATDYAESMVGVLRERVSAAGLANVECAQADLYALDFPPARFDAVIAANVLHLVPDLPGALASLRRDRETRYVLENRSLMRQITRSLETHEAGTGYRRLRC